MSLELSEGLICMTSLTGLTRAGIEVDRGAVGVEAVPKELRGSMAVITSAEYVLCLGVAFLHIYWV